jgi:hypothetical protein
LRRLVCGRKRVRTKRAVCLDNEAFWKRLVNGLGAD